MAFAFLIAILTAESAEFCHSGRGVVVANPCASDARRNSLLVLDPAARATGAALLRLKWLGGDGGPAPSPRRPILE